MTPREMQGLAREIREQVSGLERAVEDMAEARRAAGHTPGRIALWACGGTLHAFYTGVERVFETIAAALDGVPPAGPAWHRRLLERMAGPVPGVRPRVVSPAAAADLEEFLAFRHRFRNLYLFDLRWEPIRDLLDRAPSVWARVSGDLLTFAAALDRIAAAGS